MNKFYFSGEAKSDLMQIYQYGKRQFGTLQGVNAEQTAELANAVNIPVIASGGVTSMDDIKNLIAADAPIYGTIIGRAIYDGAIDLAEACAFAKANSNLS